MIRKPWRFITSSALDRLASKTNGVSSAATVLFLVMLLTGSALCLYGLNRSSWVIADQRLSSGTEKTGFIFQTNGGMSEDSFLNDDVFADIEDIGSYGWFTYDDYLVDTSDPSDIGAWFEGSSILKRDEEDSDLYTIPYLEMTSGMLKICNIQLSEGSLEHDFADTTKAWIYLGSSCPEIPIGTIIFTQTEDDIKRDYIIGGRLVSGSAWISDRLMYGGASGLVAPAWFDLDSSIVQIQDYPDLSSVEYYYTAKTSSDFSKVTSAIAEKTKQLGIDATFTTVEDMYIDISRSTSYFSRILKSVILIVMSGAVLLLICSQMMAVYKTQRVLGIWYANGASTKEVCMIIVVSEVFRVTFLLLLTSVLFSCVGFLVFKTGFSRRLGVSVLLRYMVPGEIIAAMIAEIIGIAIALYRTKNLSPSELIGNQN